jgi:hypothetical protein
VESTLQQLAQIHNISYQAPRAVIFASLQGNDNHPVDWVQPIEDPMRPTAHHLIRQLAVSKPDFRQAVALSSTSGGLLRVAFSRTPLSLRDRASLHSDHGYRSLGMYEDIAAGSPEVDVPSAKECDTLAQLLLAEQLGPSTPCYVLYFICEVWHGPFLCQSLVADLSACRPQSTAPAPSHLRCALIAPRKIVVLRL